MNSELARVDDEDNAVAVEMPAFTLDTSGRKVWRGHLEAFAFVKLLEDWFRRTANLPPDAEVEVSISSYSGVAFTAEVSYEEAQEIKELSDANDL